MRSGPWARVYGRNELTRHCPCLGLVSVITDAYKNPNPKVLLEVLERWGGSVCSGDF